MDRSGPSIEIKIVALVAAAVLVQDAVLLVMYVVGVGAAGVQWVLGSLLVLSLVVAAVWGNAISRALRQLGRACFVARKGDTRVLTELTRTDEIGRLNDEINELILASKDLAASDAKTVACENVATAATGAAPEMLRSSRELLISLKELKEGAGAEVAILGKLATRLAEATELIEQVVGETRGAASEEEIAGKLGSLRGLAREIEVLSDEIIDEVARPTIDDASLARAVNGLRDAVRTMTDVVSQAVGPLERRCADARAASRALDVLRSAESEKADGRRVAELMERSAASGLGASTRLASVLRRLGIVLEVYEERRRCS